MVQPLLGDGRQWAENHAEAAELERLDRFWCSMNAYDRDSVFARQPINHQCIGDWITDVITDKSNRLPYEVNSEYIFGDQADKVNGNCAYIHAFVEGDLELWDQVKDSL